MYGPVHLGMNLGHTPFFLCTPLSHTQSPAWKLLNWVFLSYVLACRSALSRNFSLPASCTSWSFWRNSNASLYIIIYYRTEQHVWKEHMSSFVLQGLGPWHYLFRPLLVGNWWILILQYFNTLIFQYFDILNLSLLTKLTGRVKCVSKVPLYINFYLVQCVCRI